MTGTVFSLNEAQLQEILAAQRGWWPVASVFVSALLAMFVGIALEGSRRWLERRKMIHESQERQIQQINAVISGLAFNLELLLHVSSQYILPHYKESREISDKSADPNITDGQIQKLYPRYHDTNRLLPCARRCTSWNPIFRRTSLSPLSGMLK